MTYLTIADANVAAGHPLDAALMQALAGNVDDLCTQDISPSMHVDVLAETSGFRIPEGIGHKAGLTAYLRLYWLTVGDSGETSSITLSVGPYTQNVNQTVLPSGRAFLTATFEFGPFTTSQVVSMSATWSGTADYASVYWIGASSDTKPDAYAIAGVSYLISED